MISFRCPQCTISLWRETRGDGSHLERLIKFSVAEALVAVPLTVLTLCICFAYYIFGIKSKVGTLQVLLLLGFVLSSAFVLLFMTQGLWFMVQQRRTQGVRWWRDGIPSEAEFATGMALSLGIFVAAWWLLSMSLTFEAYLGTMVPSLGLKTGWLASKQVLVTALSYLAHHLLLPTIVPTLPE